MSLQSTTMENVLQSPIPQFSHEPGFIAFRSWTTILSLDGKIPEETCANEAFLFLSEDVKECGMETLPVRGSVCLRNPTGFAHLNVTIVYARTGQKVFFTQELPAESFLHLEFLQEGSYTLYYSPALTAVTLRRNIKAIIPAPNTDSIPHNFHPKISF